MRWETASDAALSVRADDTAISAPRCSKALAANQGLYNGFLAAGLVWGLVSGRTDVRVFFLACVIVAGVYGAATVNRRILIVQAVPAAVALVAVTLS